MKKAPDLLSRGFWGFDARLQLFTPCCFQISAVTSDCVLLKDRTQYKEPRTIVRGPSARTTLAIVELHVG